MTTENTAVAQLGLRGGGKGILYTTASLFNRNILWESKNKPYAWVVYSSLFTVR